MRNHFIYNKKCAGLAVMIALLLLIAGRVDSAEVTASATLSKADFTIDESAQLTIIVNGVRSAELQIPESDGFTVFQRGRSSQLHMINGEFSSSITFSCLVQAYKKGKYTLPEIEITTDGKTLSTESIPFEVTDARSAPAGKSQHSSRSTGTAAAEEKTTFIQLIWDKRRTYVGEIIPVEIKAYFRQGLRANLKNAPNLIGDGVVMAQLHEKPAQTQKYINGTIFNVLSWETTLTSIKEGEYTLRFGLDAVQFIPQRRHSTSPFGSSSPFDDDFFDQFFGGGYKQLPLKVVSDDIHIDVQPLPTVGRPPSFTGAIGDFTLIASVEPREVETGEPLTLKMTVGGEGNFDRVEPPAFPDLPGWKTYTPTAEFIGANDSTYRGKKVFEQALVAQDNSIRHIPSLEFSFFDPKTATYVTRTTEPISVTIKGTARKTIVSAPPVTTPPAKQEPEVEPEKYPGLAPIKFNMDAPVSNITPPFFRGTFITILAVCLLTLLTIVLYGIWQNRSAAHRGAVEKKNVKKQLDEALSQLEKAAAEGDGQTFLTVCRSTIQRYLGMLWNCEPTTITRADLARNLPQETALVNILTVAEQAAYGGTQLDSDTLHKYLKQLQDSLERLS